MHGIDVAVGTDCAIRTITSLVPHVERPGPVRPPGSLSGSSAGMNIPYTLLDEQQRAGEQGEHEGDAARAPALQRDRLALRGQAAELGDEIATVLLEHRPQLRRAGDAAGGGEGLGDLVGGEVGEGPLVDAFGVRADGEDEHHVGEVDGLPPRRRADLGEGDVDEVQVPVLDEQVGRLDVPVGDAGVPELADEGQAFVDDLVVDLGVADLLGAVEELGDEQVLALGGQLDDPHRPRRRQAGVAEQAHRVVLVLDQLAHRLERPLVLEVAVEDRPPELVPAVGADVVHRVELPEQVRVGIAGDPQPQRRRSAGTGEPDGLAVDDGEAELVLHGLADRCPAAPRDVEVGGLAAPVGDREELVRREEAERQQRDGDADGDPGEDVEGMVDAEVEAGERDQGRRRRSRRTWRSSAAGRGPRRRRSRRRP